MEIIIILLILFQIKHFVCDWVIQTEEEVKYKGVYLHPVGILHSAKHGVATFLISFALFPFGIAMLFASIDFITHYHIDWLKQNYTKKFNLTVTDSKFWIAIGADQMLHQFVYLFIFYFAYSML